MRTPTSDVERAFRAWLALARDWPWPISSSAPSRLAASRLGSAGSRNAVHATLRGNDSWRRRTVTRTGHKREKRARVTKKGQVNALTSKRPACVDEICRVTGISKVDARSILYQLSNDKKRRVEKTEGADRRRAAGDSPEPSGEKHSGELEVL